MRFIIGLAHFSPIIKEMPKKHENKRGRSGLSKKEHEKIISSRREGDVLMHAEDAVDFASLAQQGLAENDVHSALVGEEHAEEEDKIVEREAKQKKTRTSAAKAVEKEREAIEKIYDHIQGGAKGHKTSATKAVAAAKKAAKATEFDAVKEASGVTVGHSKKRAATRKRERSRSASPKRAEGEKRERPNAFKLWSRAKSQYAEEKGAKLGVLKKGTPEYEGVNRLYLEMKAHEAPEPEYEEGA